MNLKVLYVLPVFLLIILIDGNVFAQQIVWAKTYRFGDFDSNGDKIVQLEDSTYAAITRVEAFGYRNSAANIIPGLALLRLDKNGDTLYVQKLYGSSSGTDNWLSKTWDSNLLIAVRVHEDTVFNAKLRIIKCDYGGNIEWMYNYIGNEWLYASVNKVIPSRDGGCFAIGSAKSIFPGNFQDMFLTKINPFGQLEWTQRYFSTRSTSGQNIEEMPDRNYLLSGGADSTIWSVVVDSNGVQLSDKIWYSNSSLGPMLSSGVGVIQGLNGGFYVYGPHLNFNSNWSTVKRYNSDTSLIYSRTFNSLSSQPIQISNDGGFVRLEQAMGKPSRFIKRNGFCDSVWSFQVGTAAGGFGFNGMAYDGLGSAVISGSKIDLATNRFDIYFLKVSNVGYPVNPLSTKPTIESQSRKLPELLAYPNPTQNYFYLQGIKSRTKLGIYNLQGHLLKEYTIQPNDAIPIWQLPSGLYIWKAEDGKRVWSGKILKEG